MNKVLADISMQMWIVFRSAGLKTSVQMSRDSRASRYVKAEGAFTIRLSDHPARHNPKSFDYEILVTEHDDPAQKMKEARLLTEQLVGTFAA